MSNLETAADELVLKLGAVDGEIEEAHQRFTSLRERLATLGEQVDADWVELARQVAAVVDKAQEERATLERASQEAEQAVAEAEAGLRAAGEQAGALLEASEGRASALAAHVREHEPRLEDLVDQAAEAPLRALAERAGEVGTELEEALHDARDFLQDEVEPSLQSAREAVEGRFAELRTTLSEECGTALQSAFDDWSQKLDEVRDLVEESGFEAAQAQAREVVDWALAECGRTHQEELERLLAVAAVVHEALEGLREDAAECRTDVGEEGGEALVRALAEATEALQQMISALDAVKQVMASYTFVQM